MRKSSLLKFIPFAIMPITMTLGSCNMNSSANTSSDTTGSDKFIPIFDGKTLNGWEGDSTYWKVENGALIGEITPANLLKSNTFIIWQGGQPADFELKTEFRITDEGNSGINYRSEMVEGVSHALKGYQADMDGARRYTGQNYEERGRTTLAYTGQQVTIPQATNGSKDGIQHNAWTAAQVTASLGNPDSLKTHIKQGDWNEYHLIVKGNRLQHYVNGILMSDVTDNDTINGRSKGLIGVQVHVGPPMKVEYRNIMLKQE